MTFLAKSYIDKYKTDTTEVNENLSKLKEDFEALDQSIRGLKAEIADLSLQIVNVDATMIASTICL